MSAVKAIQDEYLSEEETAKLMGISVSRLRSRISEGTNHPPLVRSGRQKFFPVDEFRKWQKSLLEREKVRR